MKQDMVGLARQGDWQAICTQASALLTQQGSEENLAALHGMLATAIFRTATDIKDYQKALAHALACLNTAEPGSRYHVWALYKITTLSVDTGAYTQAAHYGNLYLKFIHLQPSLKLCTPFVIRALAFVALGNHQYEKALALRMKALHLFQEQEQTDEIIRTQINIVWTYVRMGDARRAKRSLPVHVPPHLQHLYLGALCALSVLNRQYQRAIVTGTTALQGARAVHDYMDAAVIAMILSTVYRRLGRGEKSIAYTHKAAYFASCQFHNMQAMSIQQQRQIGGEIQDDSPTPSLGERSGASFTTGIG